MCCSAAAHAAVVAGMGDAGAPLLRRATAPHAAQQVAGRQQTRAIASHPPSRS